MGKRAYQPISFKLAISIRSGAQNRERQTTAKSKRESIKHHLQI